jgi:ferredoxin--NADP+ reductase
VTTGGRVAAPAFHRRPLGSSSPNATLVARVDLTPEVAIFRIRPDSPVRFSPGQYLSVGLVVGDALVRRPYSTASHPDDRELEFLVRHVATGSLTPHLWRVAVGSRVHLGPPKGLFTLAEDDRRLHLLVATGTGLAPLVSMIRGLADRAQPPRVVLVHGVARPAELAYRDRLEVLAAGRSRISYVPVVSRPADPASRGWGGETGHVDEVVRRLVGSGVVGATGTLAYLCGNPAVVGTMQATLTELGFPPDAIRAEEYWPRAASAQPLPTTRWGA